MGRRTVNMLRPEVAPASQTERLKAAMTTSAITHGQTVRADIERVEVSARAYPKELVFFCGVREVKIRETLEPGDGGPPPAKCRSRVFPWTARVYMTSAMPS